MVGTLNEVIKEMKSGVYNYTDKDGNCTRCGNCCSALLPLSTKEYKEIERYVRKHKIKPCDHSKGLPTTVKPGFDYVCPFRDSIKRICTIYDSKAKPLICESFKCDKPQKQIEIEQELIAKKRYVVNMWCFFNEV